MKESFPLMESFFRFIVHRQYIYYHKEILQSPFPWTTDPILQAYHFCNAFRELDKGTRYLMDFFQRDDVAFSREEILYHVIFYRHFNKYGLFDILREEFCDNSSWYPDLSVLEERKIPLIEDEHVRTQLEFLLENVKKRVGTLYNVAYRVAPVLVNPRHGSTSKHAQFTFVLQQLSSKLPSVLRELITSPTARESLTVFTKIPSIGPFLAYEIWTDLSYFPWFPWTDDDFVNVGPGAAWGLAILLGGTPSQYLGIKGTSHCIYLRDLQEKWLPRLTNTEFGMNWEDLTCPRSTRYPWLSLRNIEHSLCEYRKYWNLLNGKGRKRKYVPTRSV